MVASRKTVELVYDIIVEYVAEPRVGEMLARLMKVKGNASFEATIRLLHDERVARILIQNSEDDR